MNNKTYLSLIVGLILCLLVYIPSQAQSNRFEVIKNIELVDHIFEHLEKFYVERPNIGEMSVTGINAMLHELDPYTVYYPETKIEDYRLMTTGQYGGIGAVIRKIDSFVYIAEPYENSPAASSGLQAGDKILSIDNHNMEGKTTEEVSTSLKGPKDSQVKVEVERPNGQVETITITRDEIKLPDIPYHGMMSDDIGFIKLSSFTATASAAVKKSFLELKEQGMKKLVFDLRGNGGGLLMEAIRIVNFFVPKDQLVVQTKGRLEEENRIYKTQLEPLDLEIPIVVLIDDHSASASEIVSGSLQDLDRAVIVGENSFGKGLVQRTYDLQYGAKMKLTIAKYYTPSGRCVQRLEYYNREEGELVKDIPDSLIHTFKTKNGREVIDGRGIMPDVEVKPKTLSRLAATIYANNIIFDYATKFKMEHETIEKPADFKLSEEAYQKFKNYVLKQDFTYSTESEEILKDLKEVIVHEKLMEESKEAYELLMQKITPSKERDLKKYKDEVMMLLESEIVSRYYYQNGRAIVSFNYDESLNEAIQVINNSEQYKSILRIK